LKGEINLLTITIPKRQLWDETNEEFLNVPEQVLTLEHSLISLSKWESKWEIPFLDKNKKSSEQTIDYIKEMTITKNVDPLVYEGIPANLIDQINEYIAASMTATTFSDREKTGSLNEVITAEVIFYWMFSFGIPLDCQKWHLNRLLTLIRVCSIKNQPPKKLTFSELAARNRDLNAARQKQLHTKG
jgi:hypothetical protein